MTTTGGTVIVGLDHLARGALLWRGLVTWIGGMGVILLAMILLPVLNVGGMQLLRNADFATLDKVMPRAKSIALSIGAVYLVLTLACAGGYVWAGMSGFDGVVHAMSTLATGGMANYDSSFASFSPAALWVGTVFMLLGSLSFIRFVQFARGDPGALWRDSQNPRLPRDLPRLRARPPRRPRAQRRRRRRRPRCARPPSTWPRSSRRPASPRPTTASGARSPRRCSSAR